MAKVNRKMWLKRQRQVLWGEWLYLPCQWKARRVSASSNVGLVVIDEERGPVIYDACLQVGSMAGLYVVIYSPQYEALVIYLHPGQPTVDSGLVSVWELCLLFAGQVKASMRLVSFDAQGIVAVTAEI